MLVLDTPTLIGWVNAETEQSPLSTPALSAITENIANHRPLLVSPLAAYQMAKLTSEGKLVLTIPLDAWLEEVVRAKPVIFPPVDARIAYIAANLVGTVELDISQRFTAAIAKKFDCPLISPDPTFKNIYSINVIW